MSAHSAVALSTRIKHTIANAHAFYGGLEVWFAAPGFRSLLTNSENEIAFGRSVRHLADDLQSLENAELPVQTRIGINSLRSLFNSLIKRWKWDCVIGPDGDAFLSEQWNLWKERERSYYSAVRSYVEAYAESEISERPEEGYFYTAKDAEKQGIPPSVPFVRSQQDLKPIQEAWIFSSYLGPEFPTRTPDDLVILTTALRDVEEGIRGSYLETSGSETADWASTEGDGRPTTAPTSETATPLPDTTTGRVWNELTRQRLEECIEAHLPEAKAGSRRASSTMANQAEKYQRLRDFFRDSFRPEELEIFLRLNGYAEVANAVNKNVGGDEYSFAVVQALDHRGWIDAAFFDHLTKERPVKATQIESLKESWLGETVSPGPKTQASSAATASYGPAIAQTMNRTAIVQPLRVICPLHGIRTLAVWQKGLSDLAGSRGWTCRLDRWSYGRFSLFAFLTPWTREAKLNWLRRQYDAEIHDRRLDIEQGQTPSVVAHSFGTYILGYALLRFDFIRFNKVVLCGSILPVDFPWDKLIERGQVQAVRNEYGVRDPWVKRVRCFVRGTGPSGASGFACQHDRLEQEEFEYDHGDYFGIDHMEDRWIPFLNKPLAEIPRAKEGPRILRPQTSAPWCLYAALLALALLAGGVGAYVASHRGPETTAASPAQPAPVPGAVLEGYVTDAETRVPLAGVKLTIQDWDTRNGSSPTATTDAAGRFRFKDLRPSGDPSQQVRLVATKPGYQTSTTDPPLGATDHPIKLKRLTPSEGSP
jgi:hypothetical protein